MDHRCTSGGGELQAVNGCEIQTESVGKGTCRKKEHVQPLVVAAVDGDERLNESSLDDRQRNACDDLRKGLDPKRNGDLVQRENEEQQQQGKTVAQAPGGNDEGVVEKTRETGAIDADTGREDVVHDWDSARYGYGYTRALEAEGSS